MDYVIIVAGGKGLRMGSEIPKQFLPVAGKPILMRTIERFHEYSPELNIILVLPESQQEYWHQLCQEHHFSIKHQIANGGDTRFQSSKNGLALVPDTEDGVVGFHDGVRPFVSTEVIDECYETAREEYAAIPVYAVTDTLRYIDQHGGGKNVLRSDYRVVQTPQAFDIGLAKQAFNQEYKEQFTDEEYNLLKEKATEIKNIEDRLAALEEKFPSLSGTPAEDGSMSVPAGSDRTTPPDDGSMQKFPAFEGKDLDGNTVKSSELFAKNAVTVVNFWFTTCNPCVGELSELDALNKELAEKGGALIGVNTFTLDGDETAISEAKDVLAKKGATYQNVYFASDGEAGKFTTNIFAYPTTYVVDRNGNIVGDPIVGAITEKKQAEALQAQIDKALSADRG